MSSCTIDTCCMLAALDAADVGNAAASLDEAEVQSLQAAALLARTARSSLRRLIAAVASEHQASQPDPQSVPGAVAKAEAASEALEGLRETFRGDLSELEAVVSKVALPANLRERLGAVRTPGVPMRHAPEDSDAGGALDLVPRLCLRPLARERVIAAAVSARAGGCGPNEAQESVALILNTGAVEIWDTDLFSWHRSAAGGIADPAGRPLVGASMAFDDAGDLWVCAQVQHGDVQGSAARIFLFQRDDVQGFVVGASADGPPGVVIAGPLPLPLAGNHRGHGTAGEPGAAGIAFATVVSAPLQVPEPAQATQVAHSICLSTWRRQRTHAGGLELACAANCEVWRVAACAPAATMPRVSMWALPHWRNAGELHAGAECRVGSGASTKLLPARCAPKFWPIRPGLAFPRHPGSLSLSPGRAWSRKWQPGSAASCCGMGGHRSRVFALAGARVPTAAGAAVRRARAAGAAADKLVRAGGRITSVLVSRRRLLPPGLGEHVAVLSTRWVAAACGREVRRDPRGGTTRRRRHWWRRGLRSRVDLPGTTYAKSA